MARTSESPIPEPATARTREPREEFVPDGFLFGQRNAAAGVGDLDDDPPVSIDDLLVRAQLDDLGLRRVFERIAQQVEDRGEQQILLPGDIGQPPRSTGDRGHDHPILGAGRGRGVLDRLMDERVEVDAGIFDDARFDIGEFAQVSEQSGDPTEETPRPVWRRARPR